MKNRTMLSFAAGSAIAVAGLIGGTVAMATDDSPPASTQVAALDQAGATRAGEFITALAANLGVDEQTLRDAIKKTSLGMLDEAVADGRLTQEQADALRTRIESGEGGMFGFGGKGFAGKGFGHDGDRGGMGPSFMGDGGLATFLGIDSETLRSELAGGSTLAEVAAAHGKSRDELKAFLTSEINERLDQAVSEGRLTQERADEMKAKHAEDLDAMIDRETPAGGPGGGHGGHSFRGMPGGSFSGPATPGQVQ